MALFIFCGNGSSSSSTRIYMLTLVILVFSCLFSYCSSTSSFGSSSVDIGNNVDIEKDSDEENNHYYRLPFRRSSSTIDHENAAEYPVLSKNRFLKLLLKSALDQEEDPRPHRRYQVRVGSKRYLPQSFHAMRG